MSRPFCSRELLGIVDTVLDYTTDYSTSYTMIGVCPILFVGWKLIHKTKFIRPQDVDLLKDVAAVEDYTSKYVPEPPR